MCGKPISHSVYWHKHSSSWIGELLHASDGGYPDYKESGSINVCPKHFKIIQKRRLKEHQGYFLFCEWCGKIIQIDENWDGNEYTKCCKDYYMEWLKDMILCESCNHPVAQYQGKWLHKTFHNICNERKVKCPECDCVTPIPRKGRQVIEDCLSDEKRQCADCFKHEDCFGITN